MTEVVAQFPDVVYIVLSKTHPNVIKHAGEEYRLFLHRLVKKLKLEDHVIFLDQYASQDDLFKYLGATDIYLTPYLNEAQITSGTLSYAVGVGCAAVSTPYWHATELLADGRGCLFNFNDNNGGNSSMTSIFACVPCLSPPNIFMASSYGVEMRLNISANAGLLRAP